MPARIRRRGGTHMKCIRHTAFIIFACSILAALAAAPAFADVDLTQGANNDGGYALGSMHWLGSILQPSNSKYYEGMLVPQRLMLANIPASAGNNHSLA